MDEFGKFLKIKFLYSFQQWAPQQQPVTLGQCFIQFMPNKNHQNPDRTFALLVDPPVVAQFPSVLESLKCLSKVHYKITFSGRLELTLAVLSVIRQQSMEFMVSNRLMGVYQGMALFHWQIHWIRLPSLQIPFQIAEDFMARTRLKNLFMICLILSLYERQRPNGQHFIAR